MGPPLREPLSVRLRVYLFSFFHIDGDARLFLGILFPRFLGRLKNPPSLRPQREFFQQVDHFISRDLACLLISQAGRPQPDRAFTWWRSSIRPDLLANSIINAGAV